MIHILHALAVLLLLAAAPAMAYAIGWAIDTILARVGWRNEE